MKPGASAPHPPLLALPGAGGSSRVYAPLEQALPPSIRFTAIDLPGHGGVAPIDHPTLDGYAQHVLTYLDGVTEGERPILVGHSMGCLVALIAALQRPELIRGLVLLAGGAQLHVTPFVHELVAHRFDQLPAFLAKAGFSPRTPAETRLRLALQAVDAPQPVVQADFAALSRVDLTDRLPQIAHRTLVIAAADDRMVAPGVTLVLGAALPFAQTVSLPDAGHMLTLEQPDEVARLIVAWLEACPSTDSIPG